jgi:hypothetical protein
VRASEIILTGTKKKKERKKKSRRYSKSQWAGYEEKNQCHRKLAV